MPKSQNAAPVASLFKSEGGGGDVRLNDISPHPNPLPPRWGRGEIPLDAEGGHTNIRKFHKLVKNTDINNRNYPTLSTF